MKSLLITLASTVFSLSALAQANDLPVHFVKVSDAIYRGARPTPQNIGALAKLGIKLDIDLQGGDLTNPLFSIFTSAKEPGEQPAAILAEKNAAERNGIQFFNAPLDCFDPITPAENVLIDQTLALLERASAQNPVYLHCEHGKDRTGLVMALYRVKHDHWTPQAAFKEWELLGHGKINQIMLNDLDQYFWAKVTTFARPD